MEFSDSEFEDMMDCLGREPGANVTEVARMCLEQGYEFLTPRQKAIYDLHVRPALARQAEARQLADRSASEPEGEDG